MPSPELYLPDPALLHATIDARALQYIPSPAVVARTLTRSPRGRTRLRMPAHLMTPRHAMPVRFTPARAAAAAIAALGLSPAALAAATVVQLLLFSSLGWLFVRDARGIHAAFSVAPRIATRPEHVVYRMIGSAVPPATRRTAPSVRGAAAPRPSVKDSALVDTAIDRQGGELEVAVRGEIVMQGGGTEVPTDERPNLERIAAVMLRIPSARIVIQGEDTTLTTGRETVTLGARDAETVLRALMVLGVARERMAMTLTGAPHPMCGQSAECRRGRRLVRIRLAG